MAKGRFIAVDGPSGVGKDSVMAAMVQANPAFCLVRRVITRDASGSGEDHETVSEATFESLLKGGAFALSWRAHGLRYGIPFSVDASLADGKTLLANLSRSALMQAKTRFAGVTVLSLTARKEVLAERLAARGRKTAMAIVARLERARFDLPDGLPVCEVANNGPLDMTAAYALQALSAVRG